MLAERVGDGLLGFTEFRRFVAQKKKTKKNEKKWNGLLGLSRVSLQIFDEIPNNGENDPKKEVQSQYLKKYFIVV